MLNAVQRVVVLFSLAGNIDDGNYTKESLILDQQKSFQEHDKKPDEPVNPFVIVLDKGYRITMLANKFGQSCVQPIFARSDTQLKNNNDMLQSASVAVIRSGNERAIKLLKHSWIIQRIE